MLEYQSKPRKRRNSLILHSELKQAEKLSSGTFGTVYKGRWRKNTVAIKVLDVKDLDDKALLDLENEAKVMKEQGRCEQIVQYKGICLDPPYSLVMEYLPKGSLWDVLHNPEEELPWNQRLRIARDIAVGLYHLHDPHFGGIKVIHRDLKSLNILLTRGYDARVGDFGLSKIKTLSATASKNGKGTFLWMSPELLDGEEHSEASDIYALGLIFWELASREKPWGVLTNSQVMCCVSKGERPEIPADCPANFALLIRACWAQDPSKRPSASVVADALAHLIEEPENAASEDILKILLAGINQPLHEHEAKKAEDATVLHEIVPASDSDTERYPSDLFKESASWASVELNKKRSREAVERDSNKDYLSEWFEKQPSLEPLRKKDFDLEDKEHLTPAPIVEPIFTSAERAEIARLRESGLVNQVNKNRVSPFSIVAQSERDSTAQLMLDVTVDNEDTPEAQPVTVFHARRAYSALDSKESVEQVYDSRNKESNPVTTTESSHFDTPSRSAQFSEVDIICDCHVSIDSISKNNMLNSFENSDECSVTVSIFLEGDISDEEHKSRELKRQFPESEGENQIEGGVIENNGRAEAMSITPLVSFTIITCVSLICATILLHRYMKNLSEEKERRRNLKKRKRL